MTGKVLHRLHGHTGGVWSCCVSGNLIVSGSTDRSIMVFLLLTVQVWDAASGECKATLLGHTSTVRCLSLRGDVLISGSRDTDLRVWDLTRFICVQTLRFGFFLISEDTRTQCDV